jgi:hypothetical protein
MGPAGGPRLAHGKPRRYVLAMRSSGTKPWNTGRATLYGAGIGFVAAAFKLIAPESLVSGGEGHTTVAVVEELIGATLAFALLCGVAAALRNIVVARLVPPER